jgi:hypothetical protein
LLTVAGCLRSSSVARRAGLLCHGHGSFLAWLRVHPGSFVRAISGSMLRASVPRRRRSTTRARQVRLTARWHDGIACTRTVVLGAPHRSKPADLTRTYSAVCRNRGRGGSHAP